MSASLSFRSELTIGKIHRTGELRGPHVEVATEGCLVWEMGITEVNGLLKLAPVKTA
jgi:hypothetical protein